MNSPEKEPAGAIETRLKELLFNPASPEFHKRLDTELRSRATALQAAPAATPARRQPVYRLAFAGILALLLVGVILVSASGQSLAAQLFRFFIPLGVDEQPPLPQPSPWPDDEIQPTAEFLYRLSLVEAESLAGRDLLEPAWLPEGLQFIGALYDPETEAATFAYGFSRDDIRLSFIQGLETPGSGKCALCDEVGASAYIQQVSVGAVTGEYVEGVWVLTEEKARWDPTNYLKTLRWQVDKVIYQIIMMGEEFGRSEMIRFAESLH